MKIFLTQLPFMTANHKPKYCRLFLFAVFFILTACNNLNSYNEDSAEEKARMTKTAKVNAQLGIAYLEKHQVLRAKQKLLTALEQGPKIPDTWYSMGYFYEMTGDKTQANNYYLKALALAPKQGETQNNYGTFLCRSGDYKNAIQHFVLATADNNYLYSGEAYENAGLCAKKIPDHTLAMHFFEKALMQDPDRPISLINLAELNYRSKKYVMANQYLTQYLSISEPSNESILLNEKLKQQYEQKWHQSILMEAQLENKKRINL